MRIVLVDPSRAVQRIMKSMIEQGEHEVVPFGNGREALDYINGDKDVRALITSAEIGSMSGIELCAATRSLAGTQRALYILLMSSNDDFHLVVRALDHGADDFIHKPPYAEELRARLRAADRFTSMQQELIRHASTDFLTGLFNRRAFFEIAMKACRDAKSEEPLSAILFDIDHFKQVNDLHGHDAGDSVLQGVAAEALTLPGIAGRLGGEEFCVLAHCALGDAMDMANDLRRSIGSLRFGHDGKIAVTSSFGVAEWEPQDSADQLLRRADVALYEAKRSGRDRVVAADTFVLTQGHDAWRNVARVDKRRSQ
jgi:two-component system cell cycle response regulator